MASFNNPLALRRILNIPQGDNSITDTELQSYLDEAQADFMSQVKSEYERSIHTAYVDQHTGSLIQRYGVTLAPIESVFKVFVNNIEKVVTTDYTVDLDLNEVVFVDDVLNEGNSIKIVYTPKLYTLCELYMAAKNILLRTRLVDLNGETDPVYANYDSKVKNYLQVILNKTNFWYI